MLFEDAVLEPGTRALLRPLAGILASDESYPIHALLGFYRRKFPDHDPFFVIRSLAYFDDAEMEPGPLMLQDLRWSAVKEAVGAAVRTLA